MAVTVITGAYLAVGGIDLTEFLESVELSIDVDDIDSTTMATAGWKGHAAGLRGGSLTINLQADYADTKSDDRIWGWLGTTQTFEVRPTQAVAGANNPKYTGSVVVLQHRAVPATVGQKAVLSLTWPVTGAVVRAEA
jgi:hypothetical protein